MHTTLICSYTILLKHFGEKKKLNLTISKFNKNHFKINPNLIRFKFESRNLTAVYSEVYNVKLNGINAMIPIHEHNTCVYGSIKYLLLLYKRTDALNIALSTSIKSLL